VPIVLGITVDKWQRWQESRSLSSEQGWRYTSPKQVRWVATRAGVPVARFGIGIRSSPRAVLRNTFKGGESNLAAPIGRTISGNLPDGDVPAILDPCWILIAPSGRAGPIPIPRLDTEQPSKLSHRLAARRRVCRFFAGRQVALRMVQRMIGAEDRLIKGEAEVRQPEGLDGALLAGVPPRMVTDQQAPHAKQSAARGMENTSC